MFSTQAWSKRSFECAKPAAQPAQCYAEIVKGLIATSRMPVDGIARLMERFRRVFRLGEE